MLRKKEDWKQVFLLVIFSPGITGLVFVCVCVVHQQPGPLDIYNDASPETTRLLWLLMYWLDMSCGLAAGRVQFSVTGLLSAAATYVGC